METGSKIDCDYTFLFDENPLCEMLFHLFCDKCRIRS